ncbi:acyltransferase [Hyphomonas sp. WL0036]|uniref:acyltransferase family protein n=1 Tax=Hyphomonas sediminis TaxID=2866160 RepID=UPI001C7F838D|nr:acyltransferase [Hyphomonas sediminis]MBY9066844.1 acyltransferase [Hyphomonas sediminis]
MKLPSIQLLRSLAALLVAIVHGAGFERTILQENGSVEAPLVSGLFLNGYAGVDLFFVISGFIMVWVTRNQRHGPVAGIEFLFARTTRVYPVWWFAAGLMTFYALGLQNSMFATIGQVTDAAPTYSGEYILRSFLLLPQADYPILAVGWTLIHEVYFYVVFALLILAPRAFLPIGLLVWGGLVVAASFLMPLPATATNFLTLVVHPMTMEFIFGAVIGQMVISGVSWRTGTITVIAAIWLTAALCLQGVADAFTLKWGRVLLFGFPCAALIYGVATLDIQGRTVWLLPAFVGALVTGMLFQLYPTSLDAPYAVRAEALILPVIVGGGAALMVVWAGWLGGQKLPGATLRLGLALRSLHEAVARSGDWSYSLYLTHLFSFGLVKWGFGWLGQHDALAPFFRIGQPGIWDNLLFIACGLIASLIGAYITYHLIERPALAAATMVRRALFSKGSSARGY